MNCQKTEWDQARFSSLVYRFEIAIQCSTVQCSARQVCNSRSLPHGLRYKQPTFCVTAMMQTLWAKIHKMTKIWNNVDSVWPRAMSLEYWSHALE